MRGLIASVALAASVMFGITPASAKNVEVMVLGTYHFDSPGLDLNNPKVDDVLKPQRQRELEKLADALATFHPTKIMVERVVTASDLVDPRFAAYTKAELEKNRDERVQIAYRLASRLKLPVVYGIDEQPSANEPDYFPFQAIVDWAKANGAEPKLEALMAKGAGISASIEAAQATQSIPELLADMNRAGRIETEQGFYYDMLSFGGVEQQPGADLNAMWYLRNAKIFGKLQTVAQPGDRVLVIYGAGHNYWLRHFAAMTSGYILVDPVPLLEAAAAALRR